jgi:hypothetical protein
VFHESQLTITDTSVRLIQSLQNTNAVPERPFPLGPPGASVNRSAGVGYGSSQGKSESSGQ